MTGCVWVADIPGALVADEMSFGKTFTSVAAAMVSKLHTEIVVMGLPLSILWKNTLNEWVNLAQIDFPRNLGDEQEWYPLRR
jgi:SNF2 family DNA or RNA helicase